MQQIKVGDIVCFREGVFKGETLKKGTVVRDFGGYFLVDIGGKYQTTLKKPITQVVLRRA
jgi:hypothetical protein